MHWMTRGAAIALLAATPLFAASFSGKVVGITDGDTIRIMHNGMEERVRLWGIDCPEARQAFAARAKKYTSSLAFGKTVTVSIKDVDRYHRTVGIIMLDDLERRLEWWRTRFDQPVPGSEEELKKILFEVGRGRPKCQEDNVLLEVSVINNTPSMKVLADAPALRTALNSYHLEFGPGDVITSPAQIEAILEAVRSFRKGPGKDGACRFDYRFTYASYEDYYVGRERFEKYFYSAGRQRANASPN